MWVFACVWIVFSVVTFAVLPFNECNLCDIIISGKSSKLNQPNGRKEVQQHAHIHTSTRLLNISKDIKSKHIPDWKWKMGSGLFLIGFENE